MLGLGSPYMYQNKHNWDYNLILLLKKRSRITYEKEELNVPILKRIKKLKKK